MIVIFQIYEPAAYPAQPEQLITWGNNHLETLLEHYGQQKVNKQDSIFDRLVDPDICRGEFLPFKRLVFRNRQSATTLTEMMQQIFNGTNGQSNRAIFPGNFS